MRKSLKIFSSLALTATLAAAGLCLSSFQKSGNHDRVSSIKLQSSSGLQVAQDMGGCYNGDSCAPNSYAPMNQQTCQPVCPPAPACDDSRVVTVNTDLIRITKKYPPRVDLNHEFVVEMTAYALDNASNIVITETVPNGVTYIKSDPSASSAGDRLTWNIDTLRKGQQKTFRVWLKPTACGEVCGCTTVTSVPFICAPVFVGCPCITCKKTGPSRVNCGEPIDFNIVVTNTGTAVAKDVVVVENLPDEVEHASGQKVLRFCLGDIQPQETKQVTVRVKALTRCIRVCNRITTSSANCEGSACECCLDICQSIVSIRKTGPAEQYICKNADYQIVIKNEGDNVLHDVVVTDTAPNGTCIVMAPGANISGNVASWCLKCLGPNEEKAFNLKLTSKTCGTYCNKASVRASDGCGADTELCTVWKGCAGITVCVTDCEDPICVGNCNTYKITVRNQGVVADKNVTIVATLSPELQPINGSGPTACSVSGQTVSFKPVCALGPKQVAEFIIRAKAVAPGDARVNVELTSDFLTKPVHEEESTQVY